MIGRKVPGTRERAILFLTWNEVHNRRRAKLKRQARREERRWLKESIEQIS